MPFGQHERAVFEEQSTPLYEEIVASGGPRRVAADLEKEV